MRFFIFPFSLFLIIFNFSAFSDDSSDESPSSLGIYSATSSPRISSVTSSPKIYSATSSPKIRPLQISDDEFEKVQNLYKPMKKTEKARLKKLKKY